MRFKVPLIVVEDIDISRKFYEDVLQQEVILDFGANITFAGEFSLQSKESWLKFIHKTGKDVLSKPDNFELYFEEEQFDEFIKGLESLEIEFVHDIVEYPWGQRVIRFYDPDMHMIEVGEKMETVVRRFIAQGLSVEETAERTQHPVEFVKGCLGEVVDRLVRFENLYEYLHKRQEEIPRELEDLRDAGKVKSYHFRELFGEKLTVEAFLKLMTDYGIE